MRFLGVIGDQRVLGSLSPPMHNAVIKNCGLDLSYVHLPVDPKRVGDAVAGLRALGAVGANVTVPHKQAVMRFLDEISAQARKVGAVNTIVNQAGKLGGHNTDVGGFTQALAGAGQSAADKKVLLFGAGGAARAVIASVVEQGAASVTVAARELDKAKSFTDELGGEPCALDQIAGPAIQAGIIVNATSVSDPAESPEMAELVKGLELKSCRLVVDINYGRKDNFWARAAGNAGIPFLDGLPMLAHQARLSFTLWTGLQPPVEEFLVTLEAAS